MLSFRRDDGGKKMLHTSYSVESGDLFDCPIVLSGVLDLIQSGAKVSKRSFEGKSALHLAALRYESASSGLSIDSRK